MLCLWPATELGQPFDISCARRLDHFRCTMRMRSPQSVAATAFHSRTSGCMWNSYGSHGRKMSKSLQNDYSSMICASGESIRAFRLFLLSPLPAPSQNFTWEAVAAAQQALKSFSVSRVTGMRQDRRPEYGSRLQASTGGGSQYAKSPWRSCGNS